MTDVSGALPIGMALLSALMFALTFVFVRVGVKSASTTTALWLTLFVNVVFLWGWSLLVYGWQFEQWWEWRYFFLSGVFAPLLGRLFQFQGMAKLGANITTPLTLTHPVISVVLAILFLGEEVTNLGLLGALMVVLGSVVVGAQGGQNPTRSLQNVSRIYLLLPLVASLSYGISIVFRKIGIDIGSDAVTAAAVTCTSSWFFSTLYVLFTGAVGEIRCSRRELGFFVLAGIFSSLGPVLLYAALQFEGLVVIAPLAATTPLFVLLVSYVFIRADEIFTPQVIAGTVATVAGVILVTTYGLA
ncbi:MULTISPECIES: DMT family transporter [Pseudomonas]|uniref:EamA family transporter n=1 Tax=Pseudomonas lactis TaxID=1615674 RepID=A0ABS9FIY2_9PSED|nr:MULTISPECIES: DMT family transporter [Pseudomonas]MCF4971257.1 EamA family transporter [Pseudomonas lactis]MCF5000881.1 EamA family transporter [Pseudomonas lactis]MCF5008770.1 EamA family transporter [Pseudomonas lactis]MCF5010693.1 EamA family transporter [Pseudomonas lactis]MCF5019702.1 EamA family transporter [Pseudomonas lactis]